MRNDFDRKGSFLNGVPELLILRLLADRTMYGYELVAAIEQETGGALSFAEGIVYPILHALERDGLLATKRETVNGRPRVYYRLTASGKKRLDRSTDEWRRIALAVQLVLGGISRGGPRGARPT